MEVDDQNSDDDENGNGDLVPFYERSNRIRKNEDEDKEMNGKYQINVY